jgi:hypothetical protein
MVVRQRNQRVVVRKSTTDKASCVATKHLDDRAKSHIGGLTSRRSRGVCAGHIYSVVGRVRAPRSLFIETHKPLRTYIQNSYCPSK